MQRNIDTGHKSPVEKPWSLSWEEISHALNVDVNLGLSMAEVQKRLNKYGPNELKKLKTRSTLSIFVDQFKNLIVLLLAVAAALSLAFSQLLEGFAIIAAIIINIFIGFFTELKAVRSMEALQEMSRVKAKVLRDEGVREIQAEEIVPGDIIILEAGDIIPADIRLIEVANIQADESALTGESVPVLKQTEPLENSTPLADQNNMVFRGTAMTDGSGRGIAVFTGTETELGRISELAEEAEKEISPLQERLARLSYRLIWITFGIASLVVVAGIIGGKEIFLIIETAIALCVAAVPEGLPIVATVALAKGMWRMAQSNAVMNRLSAVETLGSVNTILTDKTGTLTEN